MLELEGRDRCFVVAEAGTCHACPSSDERFERAMRYVAAAHDVGADCVKFQMFNDPIRDDMFCWIDGDEERAPRWLDSVMSLERWMRVKLHAEQCGIMFLASVFQHSTVGWLRELKVEVTKVASRAAMGFPYGDAPAPFLISTGMCIPRPTGLADIYLQCEANYPSTAKWRGELLGFSDHSGTPWRAIDAIARGCKLIEVHFYIREQEAGPDLPASLTVRQLALVCEARDAFAEMKNGLEHAA